MISGRNPSDFGAYSLHFSGLENVLQIGDYNEDSLVDDADLDAWSETFGQLSAGLPADAFDDGDVDGHDFLIWQRQLGNNFSATADVHAVPEPRNLWLAAFGALYVAAACRSTSGSR